MKASELASHLDGELFGEPELVVERLTSLENAELGDVTLLLEKKYISQAKRSQASLFITFQKIPELTCQIVVAHPRKALARAIELLYPERSLEKFDATLSFEDISETTHIGPHAVISGDVTIGNHCYIGANVVIESGCVIGDHVVIHSNVTVYSGSVIGDRVIIHSGTVLGSDGFGFYQDNGQLCKILQVGNVVIEDDVEIGSNVVIDRACLGSTRVCQGAKIDNLVQISHNSHIGRHSAIAAQVGMTGGSKIGDYVMMGGQSAVDGVIIGDRVVVTGKAGVTRPISEGKVVSGFPAWEHDKELKKEAFIRKASQKRRI